MSAPRPFPNGGRIYGNKIKLVQFARRQLGMAEEDYRALLSRAAGVASSKELTVHGFESVMAEFHRMGFVYTKSARRPKGAGAGSAPGRPTPGQWRLLEALARKVGYAGLSDPRFIAWAKPRGKVEHPKMLDIEGLQRVVAALRNWIERKEAKAGQKPKTA